MNGGGYSLAGGGWWWLVVDIFWLGVVGGGGYILAGGGLWWVVAAYLSKDRKEIIKFLLKFALKFLINISCFDEEAKGCACHFVENFSKTE